MTTSGRHDVQRLEQADRVERRWSCMYGRAPKWTDARASRTAQLQRCHATAQQAANLAAVDPAPGADRRSTPGRRAQQCSRWSTGA